MVFNGDVVLLSHVKLPVASILKFDYDVFRKMCVWNIGSSQIGILIYIRQEKVASVHIKALDCS